MALLTEVLEFSSLAATEAVTIDTRFFPIGHAAISGRVPIVIAPANLRLDSLDRAFGDARRMRSPFGLLQEYLNADESALWGMVCNGRKLRVVRDNPSFTRLAWIEVDLQSMFDDSRFPDFAAFWLLCHETRFGRADSDPTDCILEQWRKASREMGIRARETLRQGVEDALVFLGQGFLSHPENKALRAALHTGVLTVKEFFQQLLRVVYRLMFLITAEERDLLHESGTDDTKLRLFARGYAMRRFRDRAVRHAAHDRFYDQWEAVKVIFRGLAAGEKRLGLPALGGIFMPGQCPDLDKARLGNHPFLSAVHRLTWIRDESSLAHVNWQEMGPEELGSVYESLLELVPQHGNDGRSFSFARGDETRGNARKTSGSYYTPEILVKLLLDSALVPVIKETKAKNPGREADALLELSIVDPACGSGHFLLAAARRLAQHVAAGRVAGTPSPGEYRRAVRDVVGKCVFGVDLNPLAVELCKVALWMEAVEPGLPLTFLDSHIQHGNALVGTTRELMKTGIPDAAWDPIEGDDKRTATALKKRNKKAVREQSSMEGLWGDTVEVGAQAVTNAVCALDAAGDSSLDAVVQKEEMWGGILGSREYVQEKLVADAWCAAFVWPKVSGKMAEVAPTNETWWQMRDGGGSVSEMHATAAKVRELSAEYRFFHWWLQFPQVAAKGGFDVVLGNPPWERVKLQEQEFFAVRHPEIAAAQNAAARKKMIARLPVEDPALWEEWRTASRKAEGESHFLRQSQRFPLCGKGDVNTYAVFAEHSKSLMGARGMAGFIVPSGIATDDTTREFFGDIMRCGSLRSFWEFENEGFFHAGRGHMLRFALTTLSGRDLPTAAPDFLFQGQSIADLDDPERHFALDESDIQLINPNTKTCPIFRTRRDAKLAVEQYRRAGVLWRESDREAGNPWGLRFLSMFHMANDSSLFRTRQELEAMGARLVGNRFRCGDEEWVPLVEAKMVHIYSHRAGTFEGAAPGERPHRLLAPSDSQLASPAYMPLPFYWVAESELERKLDGIWTRGWLLGWRDVTDARASARTVVASMIPRTAVGDKFLLMLPAPSSAVACLFACLNGFALDYAARQKVGGLSLKYFTMRQLPVLHPQVFEEEAAWEKGCALSDWIVPRVLELTYTAWDMEPLARDVGYAGAPFAWDSGRRFHLRCELDAAFFHIYGFSRDSVEHAMDTFPVVRRRDEIEYGRYRTKLEILDVYDAMSDAARTGRPYLTSLDPVPASSAVSHRLLRRDGVLGGYGDALCMGLLFAVIRRSEEAGVSNDILTRIVMSIQDVSHASTWLDGDALSEFARVRSADPVLISCADANKVEVMLGVLEDEGLIVRGTDGVVRVREGVVVPNWLPQTVGVERIARVANVALNRH